MFYEDMTDKIRSDVVFVLVDGYMSISFNRGIRPRYDIVVFSPPVHTETMKTIMKMQTFEYANQSGSI